MRREEVVARRDPVREREREREVRPRRVACWPGSRRTQNPAGLGLVLARTRDFRFKLRQMPPSESNHTSDCGLQSTPEYIGKKNVSIRVGRGGGFSVFSSLSSLFSLFSFSSLSLFAFSSFFFLFSFFSSFFFFLFSFFFFFWLSSKCGGMRRNR